MLRATMTSPGKIEFTEVPKPAIGDHDVLLRIRRIGICGSDIHVYHGKHPYTSYPVVQGHEFCGEVAEVGPSVQSFRPGDLATAPPQIVCGECVPCREGRYHICENLKVMGFQAPGVAQEFFALPESALLKLPAGFTLESGALVEPLAVAIHAVSRAGSVAGLTGARPGCRAHRQPGCPSGKVAPSPPGVDFRHQRPALGNRPAMRNRLHGQFPRGIS